MLIIFNYDLFIDEGRVQFMYDGCKLLAPVGSMDVLEAAVFSGADFVYLSGTRYGARDYADNFDYDEIKRAIQFCHKYNVKVFVTVNVSILENEFLEVVDYVYYLYNQGADGVIVQDIGLASVLNALIPQLKIHASTQMTIYDYSFIKWLCENNFTSANISREVPLSRIRSISSKLRKYDHDINLEVFVHGALCYCYSGQCLMSSFLGGRSGNRGLCAQPCRMRYAFSDYYRTPLADENYLISTKDLCTYNHVQDIIDAGANCLKIEGRMKSSPYVSSTTYAYKNAIDGNWNDDNFLLLNLAFNRGFTEGYILNKSPDEVISRNRAGNQGYPIGRVIKCEGNEVTIKFINKSFPTKIVNGDGLKFECDGESCGMYVSKILSQNKNKIRIKTKKGISIKNNSMVYITFSKYLEDKTKSIINEKNVHKTDINLTISLNNQSQMELKASCDLLEKTVEYVSEEKFEKAKNKPTSKESINNQLRKTGNTNYNIKNITYINFNENLFMPLSVINNIRRKIIEKVDRIIMQTYLPTSEEKKKCKERISQFKSEHYTKTSKHADEKWNVYISNLKQAHPLQDYPDIETVYYDGSFNYKSVSEYITNITNDLIKLREILPEKQIVWILPQILLDEDLPHIGEIIVKLKSEGINIKIQTDNIGVAKNLDVEKYGDHLNIYNNYSISKLSSNPGFTRLTVSNELSYDDIKLLKNEDCELEQVIFGCVQLMITKDDFKNLIDEELTNTYYLTDKRNNRYLIKKDCYNNSHIYDYRILNLEDYVDKLRSTDVNNFTLDCRFFSNQDTNEIIRHFQKIREHEHAEKLVLSNNNCFFIGNIEKGVYKNR